MEKKTGTAATKAKNKYNAANYERLYPFVKKGKKERYQKAAEAAGSALTSSWKKPWTNWQRRSWENKKHKPPTHTAPGAFRRLPSRVFNIFRC